MVKFNSLWERAAKAQPEDKSIWVKIELRVHSSWAILRLHYYSDCPLPRISLGKLLCFWRNLIAGLSFHLISPGRHINISSDWIRGITSPICSYFQISTHIRSFIIKKSHYHQDVKNTPALPPPHVCIPARSNGSQTVCISVSVAVVYISLSLSLSADCSQICSLFCIFALISFPGPRLAISFLSKQPNLMFWWNIQIRAILHKNYGNRNMCQNKTIWKLFQANCSHLSFLWKSLGYSVSGLLLENCFGFVELCLLIE